MAARTLGVPLQVVAVGEPLELEEAFSAARGASALLVADDAVFTTHRVQIAEIALRHRLPIAQGTREMAEVGGLMAYGPHYGDMYRSAASQVPKILKGARPADIPVEQPATFELAINLKPRRHSASRFHSRCCSERITSSSELHARASAADALSPHATVHCSCLPRLSTPFLTTPTAPANVGALGDRSRGPRALPSALVRYQPRHPPGELALAYARAMAGCTQQGNVPESREYLTRALEIFERLAP